MSTITEIETAIENLPTPQVDELAVWLERLRTRRATPLLVENWLKRAREAALKESTKKTVMALTRDEE